MTNKGIDHIDKSPLFAQRVDTLVDNMTGVYQLGVPAQLSATEVLISMNIRASGVKAIDLEIGNDFVIIDSLEHPTKGKAQVFDRYSRGINPINGKEVLFSHYPRALHFVPFGAKRLDGSPHPHAGTGFAVNQIMGFPITGLDRPDCFSGIPEEEIFYGLELSQCEYDGKEFKVISSEIRQINEFLPGKAIAGGGMSMAIPDGDDLLTPFNADTYRGENKVFGCGILRWSRGGSGWQVSDYIEVIPPDLEHQNTISGITMGFCESSLARAADSSLVYTAREIGPDPFGKGPQDAERLIVWRSTDNAKTWSRIFEVPHFHTLTPLSLGRAADGSLFISANKHCTQNFKGEHLGSMILRECLLAWPLKNDFSGLEEPLVICDAPTEFGAPTWGSFWRVDHPIALPVRLKDGKWHTIVCFRVLEHNECDSDAPMTPFTGCYVREINCLGETLPPWNF